jgi:protein-S-isoprenylcysteine O-methyltransferase Ste14
VTQHPDRPGIVAPPPLLVVGAILLGLGLHRLWPLPLWPPGLAAVRLVATALLALLAVVVFLAAVGQMHRHRTTPNPYRASTAVVASGIYQRTRNPIYVAFLLVVLAVAAGVSSLWLLIVLVPLLLILHFGVVRREERYLAAKFGAGYEEYRARVRRWL